jgi:UDP-N-acetylmuramoyl-L-alanyl-D-glutamate--2,6-diaminopimelate ligase
MWQDFKNIYHLLQAVAANLWFKYPSRDLKVIGVTGTDGKTTTSSLIYHILNAAGYNTSLIASTGAKIGGRDYDIGFHVTTPSTWQLQSFISKAKKTASDNKEKYLILELTSHAIDQNRAWGVNFEVGVLTNITDEHLDYHKNYEEYVETKFKLLSGARFGILNKDDRSYEAISKLAEFKQRKKHWLTYAIKEDADITPKKFPFKSSLTEVFNNYNILAAISACRTLGIEDEKIRKAIKSFSLPIGRVEEVYRKDFAVMVDFAHTPNAIENILSSMRKRFNGRTIHVFGSAGERDVLKRPKMGQISSKYADIIVLTSEDPRSESVDEINRQIEDGISNRFKVFYYINYKDSRSNKKVYFKINDRLEAIKFAISIAKRGDLVILTGKSHEKSMNMGKGEEPWNEYEAVKAAIQERIEKVSENK